VGTGTNANAMLLLDLTPETLQKQSARDGYGSACSGEATKAGERKERKAQLKRHQEQEVRSGVMLICHLIL
jgi:hypothetical protein